MMDKFAIEGLFSLKTTADSGIKFKMLMTDIGYEHPDILGMYYKDDPRYDPEGHIGLSGAWDSCMSINREEKLKKILNTLQNFRNNPEIYTLWQYALLNQQVATDLNVPPTMDFPSPFLLLEDIGGGVDHCLELMREASRHFQSQDISEQNYQDAMKSLVLCSLACSFNDDDTYSRIRQLIHLIGNNQPIDDVFFEGGSWGEGTHMQACRRVVEEISGVRLEAPEGIDFEQDSYLDFVDWDEVAERVYSQLV